MVLFLHILFFVCVCENISRAFTPRFKTIDACNRNFSQNIDRERVKGVCMGAQLEIRELAKTAYYAMLYIRIFVLICIVSHFLVLVFFELCTTCERLVKKKWFSGEKGYKIKIKIKTFKQFAIQTQYHWIFLPFVPTFYFFFEFFVRSFFFVDLHSQIVFNLNQCEKPLKELLFNSRFFVLLYFPTEVLIIFIHAYASVYVHFWVYQNYTTNLLWDPA